MSVHKKVIIKNKDGIHARPSSLIVECARSFECEIYLHKNELKGDAKNMLDLMSMALSYNTEVDVECNGQDEGDALNAICELFEKEFNFERKN